VGNRLETAFTWALRGVQKHETRPVGRPGVVEIGLSEDAVEDGVGFSGSFLTGNGKINLGR
jgi:hypothetical protein